ncbi:MAG: cobalamin-dependent protein [Deltaproteobacteria bacterium]|nr:cobalamin-dependent protein [Deltaproteobacteria bacterium]
MYEERHNLGLVSLIQSLIALEVRNSLEIAEQLRESQMNPKYILTACEAAMTEINELYDSGEYFIASLVMAGEIMNRVIKLLLPGMGTKLRSHFKGRVMLGNVQGEVHGLGKKIAGALLSAYGFEVLDLGLDVSAREYVEAAREFQPNVIGLSVLLTSCFHNMQDTILALHEERGDAKWPAIFIAGAQVTPALKDYYHADYYADTVFDTVRLCERLCQSERWGHGSLNLVSSFSLDNQYAAEA